MQTSPILILDTSEESSGLRIEYLAEDAVDQEINGEASAHIYHVRMLTEYLLNCTTHTFVRAEQGQV